MANRSSNFSSEEVHILLDELLSSRELVSGEFCSEFPTKKHHRDAWENIARKINSCSMGLKRTGTQVRNKWNDLKYRTRHKASSIMAHTKGTGGGPPMSEKNNRN